MKIYVDARLSWHSGIGRFVASVLPLIAEQRPGWRLRLGVSSVNAHPVLTALREMSNVELVETDCAPFSAAEQFSLEPIAHGCDLSWFTNYWVPLTWRGPYVATVHDLLHLERDLFPANFAKRMLCSLAFRKLRSSAEGLMFVSQFSEARFVEQFGEPRLSTVIHHGVDSRFRFLPKRQKKPLALVVSALKSHKNLEMLVEAWSLASLPDGWQLAIVHPGDSLRSSIWREGAPTIPNGIILGGIADEELTRLYSDAAIFMFPSKYEGFGLPLLEAAMSGCRILASTAPALIEVAEGMEVTHVDPDDTAAWKRAIEAACTNFSRTGVVAEASANLAVATQATWPAAAAKIVDFFERL